MADDLRVPKSGDTIVVRNTRLDVLNGPSPNTRDGNWRIRARVMEGEYKGEEGWLVSDTAHGPWEPPGAGFV